jgi:hypothetical protein
MDLTRPSRRPAGSRLARARRRVTRNEFEHEGTNIAGLLDAIDGADVWMIQCGEDLRLAFESCDAIRIARERVG